MASVHQLPEDCLLAIFSCLSARDVAATLLTCRRLCSFTKSETLWKSLLKRDYPESAASAGTLPSWRDAYRQLYVKETRTRNAAHRRAVLRAASKLDSTKRAIDQLRKSLEAEEHRGEDTLKQLRQLEQMRRADGIASAQVWQPRAVQSRHEQLLEQVPVDLFARIASLRQEVRVGELQKGILRRSLKAQRALETEMERELERLQYQPAPRAPGAPQASPVTLTPVASDGKRRGDGNDGAGPSDPPAKKSRKTESQML
eukprot:jgi/Mesvir1/7932/Mv11854-RA.1